MQNAKAHRNNLTLQQIRFAFFANIRNLQKTVKVKNKSATTYRQQFSFTPFYQPCYLHCQHNISIYRVLQWRKRLHGKNNFFYRTRIILQ